MVCQLTPTLFKRRVQECHQLEKMSFSGCARLSRRRARSHMLCRSRQILSAPLGAFEVTPDFLGWERSHTHSASERETCVNEKLLSGALHPSRAKFALVEMACAQLILPPISRKSGAAPPARGGAKAGGIFTPQVQPRSHGPSGGRSTSAGESLPVNKKKKIKLGRKPGFVCTSSWLWDCNLF